MIQKNEYKVFLRALEPEDIDILYNWENDTSFWSISNTKAPFSKELLRKYIDSCNQYDIYSNRQLRLVISLKENAEPIGLIDLFDFEPENRKAGVGILIASEKWRCKNYAFEALDTFIEYAFSTLNLRQLYAQIETDNHASISLFNKCNFTHSGTLKDWSFSDGIYKDQYILQLINN